MDVMELVGKLMIAEGERDDMRYENAVLSSDLDDALTDRERLVKMLDASMNNYECWNCGTRYSRFQDEDQTCAACDKEPIDYRVKHREAQQRVKALEAALSAIKAQLEDCPQPSAANGYQGSGVQEWINTAYAIADAALSDGGD